MRLSFIVAFGVLISIVPIQAQAVSSDKNKIHEATKIQPASNANQTAPEPQTIIVKISPSNETQDNADAEKEERWHEYWDSVTARATFFICIFTGLLAWFTLRLWYATKKLVEGAEKASRIQLRAYIGITEIKMVNAGVKITFRNGGQTPAYKVRLKAWPWMHEKMKTEEIKAFAIKDAVAIEEPISNATAWINIDSFWLMKLDRTNMELLERLMQTHICGMVTYEDVFGDTQEFCFQYAADFTHSGGWTFAPCQ